jgi:hypothetical protein
MTPQIASGRRTPTAKRGHWMIAQRHLGLIGVSAGFFAVSVSSFGAYLGSKMQLSAAATENDQSTLWL